MRFKSEGSNCFSNYDSINIYIDYVNRGAFTRGFELVWGGCASFKEESFSEDLHRYNYFMKQFFAKKSKDGYFRKKFIYVNELSDSTTRTLRGLFFPKCYLFLQEQYEKKFVRDYMRSIFPELASYHKNHPDIAFSKWNDRKQIWK